MTANGQRKIRVLVVDDSAFVRRAIVRMFENSSDIQVIDVASNGEMAIDMIKSLKPDVVTLDVKMPVLDGLSALERIMKECPAPVIMLSSLMEKGGDNTLRALELGAVDFVDKSAAGGAMDISVLARELISKIRMAAQVDVDKLRVGEGREVSPPVQVVAEKRETEVVLIGTSTGGPPALQNILTRIPASFPCPILIVQHMPAGFTAPLAERLDRLCAVPVKEAKNDEAVMPGTVYIAPAGSHLKLKREGNHLLVVLDSLPEGTLHRPSVDVLFESAAAACGGKILSFVLTGMGRDGASGAKAVKDAGGKVFIESEKTCIVFGMPKAVMDTVNIDGEILLDKVAETMIRSF
ncbi:protein glutamate methylesterase CheB associated with MCPs of classes 40H and 40+24H, response receiver domain-containing [Geotalea daltonii FRC-32]|uniref:Protein-glutamate methylesterase/protein-glutamine glutaminase n=1 Tax=Geotalea daltonii (strain DSM 22248 / JCM 15807 / FRC-32) TaxID=316067 RepID=B9M5G4_GEODF|nr:chemotaxis response regulator protein-glutamate methylesterase [Geotalea daltonii]ACM21723.1 protein glutamate methylesterase CheB associated with MCPs of classes 40H and 40+24H, response receiver domain-containing [Geotalea daltonii FRC-32]